MAKLLNCTKCGGSVSSDLNSCPHCGTTHFKWVNCEICGGQLKGHEAIFIDRTKEPPDEKEFTGYDTYDKDTKYYHEACYQKICNCRPSDYYKTLTCPVCKRQSQRYIPIPKSSRLGARTGETYEKCANCGHSYKSFHVHPYLLCYSCGLPLEIKNENKVIVQTYDDERRAGKTERSYSTDKYVIHKKCLTPRIFKSLRKTHNYATYVFYYCLLIGGIFGLATQSMIAGVIAAVIWFFFWNSLPTTYPYNFELFICLILGGIGWFFSKSIIIGLIVAIIAFCLLIKMTRY